MNIKTFKVAVTGPMWSLDQVRVENIDVTSKWMDDTTNGGGSVSLPAVSVSADNVLDVTVAFNGQNNTDFKLAITGSTDETPARKINFSLPCRIVKNGWLSVTVSKTIDDLVQASI